MKSAMRMYFAAARFAAGKDLEEVLGDGKGDLSGTAVLCEDCSRELMEVRDGDGSEA